MVSSNRHRKRAKVLVLGKQASSRVEGELQE